MKTIAASFVPPIALDPRAKSPFYLQLYDWFRGAIIAGKMRPGQRVPSTRILAAELKISYIYAIQLCQRHRYKVRWAGSSKPPRLPFRSARLKG